MPQRASARLQHSCVYVACVSCLCPSVREWIMLCILRSLPPSPQLPRLFGDASPHSIRSITLQGTEAHTHTNAPGARTCTVDVAAQTRASVWRVGEDECGNTGVHASLPLTALAECGFTHSQSLDGSGAHAHAYNGGVVITVAHEAHTHTTWFALALQAKVSSIHYHHCYTLYTFRETNLAFSLHLQCMSTHLLFWLKVVVFLSSNAVCLRAVPIADGGARRGVICVCKHRGRHAHSGHFTTFCDVQHPCGRSAWRVVPCD